MRRSAFASNADCKFESRFIPRFFEFVFEQRLASVQGTPPDVGRNQPFKVPEKFIVTRIAYRVQQFRQHAVLLAIPLFPVFGKKILRIQVVKIQGVVLSKSIWYC
jgi:hypothetical protein